MANSNEYVEELFLLLTKPANRLTGSERAAISTALYALETKAVITAYEVCRSQATANYAALNTAAYAEYTKDVNAAVAARDLCFSTVFGGLCTAIDPFECKGYLIDNVCYFVCPEGPPSVEGDACLQEFVAKISAARAKLQAAINANALIRDTELAECEKLNKPVTPRVREQWWATPTKKFN